MQEKVYDLQLKVNYQTGHVALALPSYNFNPNCIPLNNFSRIPNSQPLFQVPSHHHFPTLNPTQQYYKQMPPINVCCSSKSEQTRVSPSLAGSMAQSEEVECVICNKTYRSSQFQNHLQLHRNRVSLNLNKFPKQIIQPQQYSFQNLPVNFTLSSHNSSPQIHDLSNPSNKQNLNENYFQDQLPQSNKKIHSQQSNNSNAFRQHSFSNDSFRPKTNQFVAQQFSLKHQQPVLVQAPVLNNGQNLKRNYQVCRFQNNFPNVSYYTCQSQPVYSYRNGTQQLMRNHPENKLHSNFLIKNNYLPSQHEAVELRQALNNSLLSQRMGNQYNNYNLTRQSRNSMISEVSSIKSNNINQPINNGNIKQSLRSNQLQLRQGTFNYDNHSKNIRQSHRSSRIQYQANNNDSKNNQKVTGNNPNNFSNGQFQYKFDDEICKKQKMHNILSDRNAQDNEQNLQINKTGSKLFNKNAHSFTKQTYNKRFMEDSLSSLDSQYEYCGQQIKALKSLSSKEQNNHKKSNYAHSSQHSDKSKLPVNYLAREEFILNSSKSTETHAP